MPAIRAISEAHLTRLLAASAPICDWALAVSPALPAPGWVPLLLLDARPQPGLAELVAHHNEAGGGTVSTRWQVLLSRRIAVLSIRIRTPRPGRLRVAFSFPRHEPLLEALLDCGALGILPDEPGVPLTLERARGAMLLPCVREPLDGAMNIWRHGRAGEERRN